jgi:hypothetical protein
MHAMIGLIVAVLVIAVVTGIFDMDERYKRLIFGIVLIVVLIAVLGLLGIWHYPLR